MTAERPGYHGRGQPRDNIVLPFQLEPGGIRGRFVTLGTAADKILSNHDHPHSVARLEAELLALAACLADTLKYKGVFTLQVNGNGPVKTLMADVTSDGALRGYAGFDAPALAAMESEHGPDLPLQRLTNGGYIAFTVDQGQRADRYQGLVELSDATLATCATTYFRNSEQIGTGLQVAATRSYNGSWRSSALMIQKLPAAGNAATRSEIRNDLHDENWHTALVLMNSCTAQELVDPTLAPEALLYGLFHETGVRVYPEQPLVAQCRCSGRKVENVLRLLTAEQLADMTVDGVVTVTCEFCKTERRYDEAALSGLRAPAGASVSQSPT